MRRMLILCGCLLCGVALWAQPDPDAAFRQCMDTAKLAVNAGHLPQAEAWYLKALEEAQNLGGDVQVLVLENLAKVRRWQGKFAAAEADLRTIIAILTPRQMPVDLGQAWNALAAVCHAQGKTAEAEEAWGKAVPLLEGTKATWALLATYEGQASMYLDLKQPAKAEAPLVQALALARTLPDLPADAVPARLVRLAECRRLLKKTAEAQALFTEALTAYRAHPELDAVQAAEAHFGLARCADDRGEGAPAVAHYADGILTVDAFFGPSSPSLPAVYARVAAAHAAAGRKTEALALLDRAIPLAQTLYGPGAELSRLEEQRAGVEKAGG